MKVLFLPNFRVAKVTVESEAIFPANQISSSRRYWFFKFFTDAQVDVIDNRSPLDLGKLAGIRRLGFFQALKAFVNQNNYDVVISHSFNSGFVFAVLRSLVRMRKPNHVVIDIGCLNGASPNPLQIKLIRFALKTVRGLVYHSSVNEEFYSRFFPDVPRKFVAFGVDTDFFRTQARRHTDNYALSIGADKRDYATLLRAWRGIAVPLRIVGPNSLDTSGVQNVTVEKPVDIKTLRAYIDDSLFVVLPIEDRRYSVGQMTLLQCMSMKKTVLSSNVRGVSDYCVDGVNCLLYKSGDEEDLASKVRYIIGHGKDGDRISNDARESVTSSYTEEAMAQGIERFIESIIN